jgi:hypothetical protein
MKTLLLKLVRLKRLVNLILIVLIAVACKKTINLNRNWEGYVFDKNTGNSVAGAIVKIKASIVSSGVFNSSLQPIATVTTDNNGFYSFEYERNNFAEIVAEVNKPNYFVYTQELEINEIADNKNVQQNFTVTPRAWIRVQIEHQGNGVDQINLNYRNLTVYRDCLNCCKNDNLNFSNENVNHSSICTSEGNLFHRYRTLTTVNGQKTELIDSVYLTAGDTTLIDIVY